MKNLKTQILLVDDDPKLLRSLARQMAEVGFEVLTAISAAEAMVILSREKVDVIVSDNQMSGTNGTRLLATVCKKYPSVLRFMLTGDITKSHAWLVENEIGVCKLFEKPCKPDEIIREIASSLSLI